MAKPGLKLPGRGGEGDRSGREASVLPMSWLLPSCQTCSSRIGASHGVGGARWLSTCPTYGSVVQTDHQGGCTSG